MSVAYYPRIAVYSSATAAVPYSTVKRVADACGRATYYDYGYWWGNFASIYPFQYQSQVPPGYWHCKLLHISEHPGFQINGGGWHEGQWQYVNGQWTWTPVMICNAAYISSTKATLASHEILEAMADPGGPYTNSYIRWIWSPKGCNWDGSCNSPDYQRWVYGPWVNEVCDPVYNWEYPYTVSSTVGGGTVTVSDFITPNWWNRDLSAYYGVWYDKLGRLTQPLQFSWWGGSLGWLQAGFAWGS